jgi:hypothetical protein
MAHQIEPKPGIYRIGRPLCIAALVVVIFLFFILPSIPYLGGSFKSGTVKEVNGFDFYTLVDEGDQDRKVGFSCIPGKSRAAGPCGLQQGEIVTYVISLDQSKAHTIEGLLGNYLVGAATIVILGFLIRFFKYRP